MLGPIIFPALQKGSFEGHVPVKMSSMNSGLTPQRQNNYSVNGEGNHKDTVVPGLLLEGC